MSAADAKFCQFRAQAFRWSRDRPPPFSSARAPRRN